MLTREKRKVRAGRPRGPEGDGGEPGRIRRTMRKWRKMDEPAVLLGRGLGERELVSRVALEVGTSLRRVLSALRGGGDE